MPSSSMIALIKCRWREFRREPSAFFFVIFMPILWMVLLGFAFGGDSVERFGIGWDISGTEGPLSARVKEALETEESILLHAGSSNELSTKLKRGKILVIARASGDSISYSFDPANRESKRARDIANNAAQIALGRKPAFKASNEKISIPGTRYVDFLIPGLLAFSILTSSIFGTGMTIVSNRSQNLLMRYLATPMKAYQFIISHMVGRLIILAAEMASILIAAKLIFGFSIAGSYFDFIVVAILGTAALTAIALLFAARTDNTAVMNGSANLFVLPMMLLSGVWFSSSGFPDWLSSFASWLPLTPLVEGLRQVALEGAGLADLQFQLGLLCAYTVAGVVATKTLFKWY